ncbi:hypothetical protein IWQ60_001848 [Tieghemiomyces parasiticus]|uniref:Uncharacterized protein n=1 Tax=Tieghemiomyces parasiticus TaxID=78921 RepID=A0A9W8AD71_9FUNG|nr:hypothetical protein IWQ60_001848 [Tieghemiomyces parasiticus]
MFRAHSILRAYHLSPLPTLRRNAATTLSAGFLRPLLLSKALARSTHILTATTMISRLADLPALTARVHTDHVNMGGYPHAELALLKYIHNTHRSNIVYMGFRSKHLPHKLYSQWVLGATPERLRQTYDDYLPRLEPLPKTNVTITRDNLMDHLGQRETYGAYLRFFDHEISERGMESVFQTYYPLLLAGMYGGLTHPMIHIGYAIEFHNDQLLSEGLAYACSHYLDMAAVIDQPTVATTAMQEPPQPQTATDPWLSLHQVAEDASGDFQVNAAEPRFSGRAAALLGRPAVMQKLSRLVQNYLPLAPADQSTDAGRSSPVTPDVLRRLAVSTVGAYAGLVTKRPARLDFFLAHAVTSLYATFMIVPHLTDPRDQVRQLRLQLFILLAVYAAEGRGTLPKEPHVPADAHLRRRQGNHRVAGNDATPPFSPSDTESDSNDGNGDGTMRAYPGSWHDIRERAVAADDDHVAKVVRALDFFRRVYGDTNDELFHHAALHTVDQIQVKDDWRFQALPQE